MNLYDETTSSLEGEHYTWDDVAQIQANYFAMSVERFKELASKIEYTRQYFDGGRGAVNNCLVILMNDGSWFERGMYDVDEKEAWLHFSPPKPLQVDDGRSTRDTLMDPFWCKEHKGE